MKKISPHNPRPVGPCLLEADYIEDALYATVFSSSSAASASAMASIRATGYQMTPMTAPKCGEGQTNSPPGERYSTNQPD